MTTTRGSLLFRLRNINDHEAWREFHELYAPFLYRYARKRQLSQADAEEVRDRCMAVLADKMRSFEYDKEKGGFKNWLRRIANNTVVDLRRKRHEKIADSADLRSVRDPSPSPKDIWEKHWRDEHLKYCLENARERVSERNFQIFEMLLIEGRMVQDVCQQLGLQAEQVYKAKARVLKHVSRCMVDFE